MSPESLRSTEPANLSNLPDLSAEFWVVVPFQLFTTLENAGYHRYLMEIHGNTYAVRSPFKTLGIQDLFRAALRDQQQPFSRSLDGLFRHGHIQDQMRWAVAMVALSKRDEDELAAEMAVAALLTGPVP